ncbi:MAG: EamA family transporter RarD [Opitutae bacterium]|nr:EamA family transporter RarD [Opitutae bacterium]
MPAAEVTAPSSRGALAAGVCYVMWGLFPLYWKQLAAIDARELIAHRIVWSLAFVAAATTATGAWGTIRAALATRRSLAANLLTGALLSVNWLVFVWGVNHGHILETSLGYFLVPLVNVALGRLVLHEHLRPAQWAAIACAAAGVALQLLHVGRLPWIALALAATFGAYGLLRKRSPLGSLAGLTVETLLLAPLALAYLYWCHRQGTGALGRVSLREHAFVLSAGVVTAVPLLLFAYGARRIRLTTLGLLQYLAPTGSFLVGVFVYGEAFDHDRLLAFACIWLGLALYTADNLRQLARRN